MFQILVSIVSLCLCLVFPLLLTVKSLNNLDSRESSTQLNQLKFLFHYWIYYILVSTVQASLFVQVLDVSLFNVVNLAFLAVKIWLFYGKGCLVISYYYAGSMFARLVRNRSNSPNLEVIEVKFLDPMANLLIFNSGLVNHVFNLVGNFSGVNNLINSIVLNFQNFNSSLSDNYNEGRLRSPYFLDYSLVYFCTIDNQTVYRQYKYTSQLLNLFSLNRVSSTKPSRQASHKSSFPNLFNKKSRASPGPVDQSMGRSNSQHSRKTSNNSYYRNTRDSSPSVSPNTNYLSPTGSPLIPNRIGSQTERIETIDAIDSIPRSEIPRSDQFSKSDQYSRSEPFPRVSDPIADTINMAFSSGNIASNKTRSRSSSNGSNQVNLPPNAISIDQLLNSRFDENSRSRGSSIKSDTPYPVM